MVEKISREKICKVPIKFKTHSGNIKQIFYKNTYELK